MDYIDSLFWLATWPFIIFIGYKFASFNIKHFERLERLEKLEEEQ